MQQTDLQLLLEHEAKSLAAVAELSRASLLILQHVRGTQALPDLVAPCLDAAINQCEQAARLARAAGSETANIARDLRTLAELRAAHDERRMR